MNLLDDIQAAIGSVFSDTGLFFSDATLTRPTQGGGWNEPSMGSTSFSCKAMRDSYNDHQRSVAGIPGTDVKLMIVGASLATAPKKGDSVRLNGQAYTLRDNITTDPAHAMWEAQATPVAG